MSERIKEVREWGTFLLTLLTVGAVPIGALVLHNQKLEIEQDTASKYVQQADFKEFQTVTNNKVDELGKNVAKLQTEVAVIRATPGHKEKDTP